MPAIMRPPHPGRAVFAANLKRLRQEVGLTQEALANRAGLDRSFYVEVEQGRRAVSVDRILEIAGALDRPVGELFVGL